MNKQNLETLPNIGLLSFVLQLENELSDCETILDVGCGEQSPLVYLKRKKHSVGVDGHKPSIGKSNKRGIHDEYKHGDIRKLSTFFKNDKFDAVIALDVVEHLNKKDGHKLLKDMETLSTKKVIINTPNGYIPQQSKKNKLQEHLSGWTKSDFEKRGYKVIGMYGWKPLRKEEASIRYRPKNLWVLLSLFTHFTFSKWFPGHAFSLFAVKQKNKI